MAAPDIAPPPDTPQTEASAGTRPVGVATSVAYLPELEGLRGVAIALVVVFHTDGFLHFLQPPAPDPPSLPLALMRAGHTGVSLFFVLSGFLLSLPWWLSERRVEMRHYFARRALRILPAYYAAVAAAALVHATSPADLTRALPYLVFLNGAGLAAPLSPFSEVWWSLATEVEFYLVLPVIMALVHSRRLRWLAVLVGLGWAAAYAGWCLRYWGPATVPGNILLGLSLVGRAPMFVLGAAAAYVTVRHGAAIRARLAVLPFGTADGALLAIVLGLAALLRWTLVVGSVERPRYHAWHLGEALLWTAVLLLAVLAPLRLVGPLLRHRAVVRLGVLSYSVYLLHLPILVAGFALLRRAGHTSLTSWNARSLAAMVLLWAVCLAAAAVTYRVIERPFLIRKERVRR